MHSSCPPPFVAPDSKDGRMWALEDADPDLHTEYCHLYEPHESMVALARNHRYCIYECKNRTPFGERRHNWCFRCPAGFLLNEQHIYDAELSRDRVMFT